MVVSPSGINKIFINLEVTKDAIEIEEVPWCLPCDTLHQEWECPQNQGMENDEGVVGPEILNVVEDLDHICAIQPQTNLTISDQMRQTKEKSVDAARVARMNMLNAMDEEAKNKLRKQKLIQYNRRMKASDPMQASAPEPQRRSWSRPPLPLNAGPITSKFEQENNG